MTGILFSAEYKATSRHTLGRASQVSGEHDVGVPNVASVMTSFDTAALLAATFGVEYDATCSALWSSC
jgi:hypothetical protein